VVLFDKVVELLTNKQSLPRHYKDHKLKGDKRLYRELHILDDFLLAYRFITIKLESNAPVNIVFEDEPQPEVKLKVKPKLKPKPEVKSKNKGTSKGTPEPTYTYLYLYRIGSHTNLFDSIPEDELPPLPPRFDRVPDAIRTLKSYGYKVS
jgi:mRNA-degrading endonuclease YafQ of YafQ-DinJ toxin-antitoxin module